MAQLPDDLATMKDDMVAFVEGHGMRRFPGFVDHEEVQTVMWKPSDETESWKDFVELAKTAGSPFVTMDSWQLERTELDEIIQRLSNAEFTSDEDLEDARWLKTYMGKTGFLQPTISAASPLTSRGRTTSRRLRTKSSPQRTQSSTEERHTGVSAAPDALEFMRNSWNPHERQICYANRSPVFFLCGTLCPLW